VGIRRVVTGHDAQGRSVFARDESVEALELPLFPGWQFFDMWGGDSTPRFPDGGEVPTAATYFPPLHGFRFTFSTIPPVDTPPAEGVDEVEGLAEVERALPGMMSHLEADGMHTTDSIDFEVVISGKVYLQLDSGEERLLLPGDTVVQNGTRHVWRNPGPEPCLLAVVMIGAHRVKD
jgi:mannose-6-phosphate isomerase-like protein (cupin superfamily)